MTIPALGALRGRTIAIVAMGQSASAFIQMAASRGGVHGVADFIVAINAMGGVIQHDLLIAMDDLRVQEERVRAAEAGETGPVPSVVGTQRWLMQYRRPFVTSRAWPERYPYSEDMPIEAVLSKLGTAYMNNTVSWALAWALCHDPRAVQLWGCDFSYAYRHGAEAGRGSVEFLCGIAHSRGILIQVPAETSLLDSDVPDQYKPYGYDSEDVEIEWGPDHSVKVKRTPRTIIPSGREMEERYRRR